MDEIYDDVELKCQMKDCDVPGGRIFVWSVKDQEFYRDKGWEKPKRCKKCVQKKKDSYAAQGLETNE